MGNAKCEIFEIVKIRCFLSNILHFSLPKRYLKCTLTRARMQAILRCEDLLSKFAEREKKRLSEFTKGTLARVKIFVRGLVCNEL